MKNSWNSLTILHFTWLPERQDLSWPMYLEWESVSHSLETNTLGLERFSVGEEAPLRKDEVNEFMSQDPPKMTWQWNSVIPVLSPKDRRQKQDNLPGCRVTQPDVRNPVSDSVEIEVWYSRLFFDLHMLTAAHTYPLHTQRNGDSKDENKRSVFESHPWQQILTSYATQMQLAPDSLLLLILSTTTFLHCISD